MGRCMRRPPKYCHHKQDRHGGAGFWYFERRGFARVRLQGLPWSPEFMAAYEAAMNGKPLPVGAKNVQFGSMADLIARYYASAAFRGLERSTQQVYRRIIEGIRERHGDKVVAELEARHIRKSRCGNRKAYSSEALHFDLSILLAHGIECGIIDRNPAEGIKGPKIKTIGFHSWTEEEIAQFEVHPNPGTRERLALALLLYTGQRRSDVVRMGPQHVRDGDFALFRRRPGGAFHSGLSRTCGHYRGVGRRTHGVPGNSTGQAIHGGRLWQLVPRSL